MITILPVRQKVQDKISKKVSCFVFVSQKRDGY